MTPAFDVRCLQKRIIAPNVYELHLKKPANFTFAAGQFVLFDVPLHDNPNDIQTRAYSIASAPTEADLLFVIKLVPNGRASRWIDEKLAEGDVIHMQGPFGRFLLKQDETPVLMASTGTGIAPFRSQILDTFHSREDSRVFHLVQGVISPTDFFWEEDLRELETKYPNVHVHASYLSGEADWHGETGSVQERVYKLIKTHTGLHIYLCGPPGLVSELKKLSLESGVEKGYIHGESYV